ncbi:MAG: STT3 domain-containing protein [Elusimicrobia bacterium]|nr:STT3 domain-containing protein [Elusimicrobiota bacterium]
MKKGWALGGLVLAALGVRALSWLRVFHDGRVFFFGNDSWYHMRRIEYAVGHDLRLPGLDPYLNFPDGGASLWGGLFDKLAAAAALLSGAAYRGAPGLEAFCAWLPAVLGALCVLAVFLLGRSFFGEREGFVGAAVLAVLPGHVQYSVLGNLDHHVLECLLFGAASAALVRGRDVPGPRCALAAGALLWLLFLTHPALACLYAAVLWAAALAGAAQGWMNPAAPWAFLAPAVLLLPGSFRSLSGAAGVSRLGGAPAWLMYEGPSFLQPLLLAFCGLSLLLALRLRRARSNAGRIAAAAAGLGVLGAALAWPLASGAGELFKRDPWLKFIAETRPLLAPSPEAPWALGFAAQNFGYWFFLQPVWWLWTWRRPVRGRPDYFLLVWSGALLALVNIQLRFMPVFALALALALASAAVRLWDLAAGRAAWRRAAVVAVLAAGLWPSWVWLQALGKGSRFKYLTLSDQVYEMLLALRDRSPATAGYENAEGKPEYGVLAPWDFGHAIVYLAHRPVVADPFGHGVGRSYRYYAAVTPEAALRELGGVRYVMAQDLTYPLTQRILADYLGVGAGHPLRRGDWLELFHMKLLAQDPARTELFGGHRLVYRSPDGRESLYEVAAPPFPSRGSDFVH